MGEWGVVGSRVPRDRQGDAASRRVKMVGIPQPKAVRNADALAGVRLSQFPVPRSPFKRPRRHPALSSTSSTSAFGLGGYVPPVFLFPVQTAETAPRIELDFVDFGLGPRGICSPSVPFHNSIIPHFP